MAGKAVKKAAGKGATKAAKQVAGKKVAKRTIRPAAAAAAEQVAAAPADVEQGATQAAPAKRAARTVPQPANGELKSLARLAHFASYPAPTKKGVFRVALRVGSARALGFVDDPNKAVAGGLTPVKDNGVDYVYEGTSKAMNGLLRDLRALAASEEGKSNKHVATQAIARVEYVLAQGPYTGKAAPAAEQGAAVAEAAE